MYTGDAFQPNATKKIPKIRYEYLFFGIDISAISQGYLNDI